MAKLKMLKLPKKPKLSASISVLQNYLDKVKAVKAENSKRVALNKKRDQLAAQVAGIGKLGAISAAPRKRRATASKSKSKSKAKTKARRKR